MTTSTRRLALACVLATSTMVLAAAERATFILSDGERMSGEVVFHTEARTNIRADKNEFNLKINTGAEVPIPFSHVVYIDFVGGQPQAQELSALPSSGHLMTLRNGETRRGRLVDFIAGTTVKWSEDGRESETPIRDVRRIFLDLDRVREMFPTAAQAQAPSVAQPSPTPTTGQRQGQPGRGGRFTQPAGRGTTVSVRGAVPWTDTNITVRGGQMVSFSVSGQVFVRRDNAGVGPDGSGQGGRGFPVPEMLAGGLIGRIGTNGAPFAIGGNTQPIRMPANGRLWLGINDNELDDNSGTFQVVVTQ
jgi:hypothetical protein